MDIPLRAHGPIGLAAIAYVFASTHVVIENLVKIRGLPASAYASVQ